MWNLSGNDIEQAKERLKGRRAAIKARCDEEMKRVADELAAIEKFEREAREFLSHFKPDAAPAQVVTESEAAAEMPLSADEPSHEWLAPLASTEEPVEATDPAAVEAAGEHHGASRWRLRLNGASEAA